MTSTHFQRIRRRGRSCLDQASSRATGSSTGAELAAYTDVASLILNLDETVTKE